jgi:hypothetical protein
MPGKLLRSVGLGCFVRCFDDFRAEHCGLRDRADTIEAMMKRGGALTDASANSKASSGVGIFKRDLVGEALHLIIESRIPRDQRDRARELLAKTQSTETRQEKNDGLLPSIAVVGLS